MQLGQPQSRFANWSLALVEQRLPQLYQDVDICGVVQNVVGHFYWQVVARRHSQPIRLRLVIENMPLSELWWLTGLVQWPPLQPNSSLSCEPCTYHTPPVLTMSLCSGSTVRLYTGLVLTLTLAWLCFCRQSSRIIGYLIMKWLWATRFIILQVLM